MRHQPFPLVANTANDAHALATSNPVTLEAREFHWLSVRTERHGFKCTVSGGISCFHDLRLHVLRILSQGNPYGAGSSIFDRASQTASHNRWHAFGPCRACEDVSMRKQNCTHKTAKPAQRFQLTEQCTNLHHSRERPFYAATNGCCNVRRQRWRIKRSIYGVIIYTTATKPLTINDTLPSNDDVLLLVLLAGGDSCAPPATVCHHRAASFDKVNERWKR